MIGMRKRNNSLNITSFWEKTHPRTFEEIVATKRNITGLLNPGSFEEATMVADYLIIV